MESTMKEILLTCLNITKSFNRNILNNVTFHVQQGEFLVITGKSGQGKSVLLSILSGIDRADAGEIIFANQSFSKLSNDELAKLRQEKIGIIFQNFNLISSWTALENIEAGIIHKNISKAEKRAKARELLKTLKIAHCENNYPRSLSMGEQQRVAIARTLIKEPCLILADEPTGDVDPETAQEIITILMQQIRTNNVSLIVATHGSFPLEQADRVMTLREGRFDSAQRPS
jgi:putative ABC transport system ATP-binding protein